LAVTYSLLLLFLLLFCCFSIFVCFSHFGSPCFLSSFPFFFFFLLNPFSLVSGRNFLNSLFLQKFSCEIGTVFCCLCHLILYSSTLMLGLPCFCQILCSTLLCPLSTTIANAIFHHYSPLSFQSCLSFCSLSFLLSILLPVFSIDVPQQFTWRSLFAIVVLLFFFPPMMLYIWHSAIFQKLEPPKSGT